MNLTDRERFILYDLLDYDRPYTAEELSKRYKVSKRTLYSDLKKIKMWLMNKNIELCIKPHVGIWLNRAENSNDIISEIKREIYDFKPYVTPLSKEERINAIISILLKENAIITIEEICSQVGISRTTFYHDLNEIETWLRKFNLKVVKIQKKGVIVKGSENDRREAVINFLMENLDEPQILNLLEENSNAVPVVKEPRDMIIVKFFFNYLSDINLNPIKTFIEESEKMLGYEFTDSAYIALTVHIATAVKRIKEGFIITIDEQKLSLLKRNHEYEISKLQCKKLEEAYAICIPEAEAGYITLHFLSSKLNNIYKDELKTPLNRCIDHMIKVASKALKIDLSSDKDLFKGLSLHLTAANNRLIYGITEQNPLKDMVLQKYANLYPVAKMMAEVFEQDTGYSLDDEEISFIIMYLGASLERIKGTSIKKVYAVCPSGLGGAQLLVANLKNKFPNIIVKGNISMSDAELLHDRDVDAIISTVNFRSNYLPVISVSPFISEADIIKIKNTLNVEDSTFQNEKRVNDTKLEDIIKFVDIISDIAYFIDKLKNKLMITIDNNSYLGLIVHLIMNLSLNYKDQIYGEENLFKDSNAESETDLMIFTELNELYKKYGHITTYDDISAIKAYLNLG